MPYLAQEGRSPPRRPLCREQYAHVALLEQRAFVRPVKMRARPFATRMLGAFPFSIGLCCSAT